MTIKEYVPDGETVQDWSRMITVQVFHSLKNVVPDRFADNMRQSWAAACAGSEFEALKSGGENGYPFSLWRFSCPLNSQTGKPETPFIKFVGGVDALYVIQYAYRSRSTSGATDQALDYLKGATVCDTRKPDHPCPHLLPVGG